MKITIEEVDLDTAVRECREHGWNTNECVLAQAAKRQSVKHPSDDIPLAEYYMGAQFIACRDNSAKELMWEFDGGFNRTYLGSNIDDAVVEEMRRMLPITVEL